MLLHIRNSDIDLFMLELFLGSLPRRCHGNPHLLNVDYVSALTDALHSFVPQFHVERIREHKILTEVPKRSFTAWRLFLVRMGGDPSR